MEKLNLNTVFIDIYDIINNKLKNEKKLLASLNRKTLNNSNT